MGSISRDFTKDEQNKVSLNGTVYDFSVDDSSIEKEDMLNIHEYLMVQNNIKCLVLFKKMFIRSLASIVKASNHIKCISLSNQQCMARPSCIDLNSDEYNQGLYYYSFFANLDRINGSCNTLDDLSNIICEPYKIEYINLTIFNCF